MLPTELIERDRQRPKTRPVVEALTRGKRAAGTKEILRQVVTLRKEQLSCVSCFALQSSYHLEKNRKKVPHRCHLIATLSSNDEQFI
jgi:hypothetical protein